ncbi:MAG: glycosyltransferase [Burkholderiales bacterium]|uniref:glycosyltransferase n=1 Tax=Limnobacter sp. TaxID=2003368 RepID=UPI0039BD3F3F|nr:glycosyltransferase [Burkholderiales bacterium]
MKTDKVAYLVNQYPKVSHTFIRREILALEAKGLKVSRFSVRGWENELPDPVDEQERQKTRYLLQEGMMGLLSAGISVFLQRPKVFLKTLWLTLRISMRADRPLPFHLVYLLEACKALQWLEQEKIEHVHAHFGANSTTVAMLIRLLGGPTYSFTVHGPEEFDKPEFIHLGLKVQHAAFVVAITSYCRSQIFRWISYSHWYKVKIVHCGIDENFYSNAPDTVVTEPRLVCVGRLCEQKGQLILLEAAQRLQQKGIPFQLILAGDGEMRPEIERQIDQRNLRQQVQITGWISSMQVRDELLKSKAMVLPSFGEGLPVVIMEAMALKRPVISTYIAGIPELVEHGVNGYLCPSGDVEKLAELMETCLLATPDALARMGQQAQLAVLQQHNMATEADKLASLFSEFAQ